MDETQVIPFVAGGFMYIGAVAVLPTYVFVLSCAQRDWLMTLLTLLSRLLQESKSGKQALREVRMRASLASQTAN